MDDFDPYEDEEEIEDFSGEQEQGPNLRESYDRVRETKEKLQGYKEKIDKVRNQVNPSPAKGQMLNKTGGQVAKKATSEGAKKAGTEVAKKAGTEVAKKAGTEAAKKAGTEVAKQAAKKVAAQTALKGALAATGVGAIASAAMIAVDVAKAIRKKTDEKIKETFGIDLAAMRKARKKATPFIILALILSPLILTLLGVSTVFLASEDTYTDLDMIIAKRETRYKKALVQMSNAEIRKIIKKDYNMNDEDPEKRDMGYTTYLKKMYNTEYDDFMPIRRK